MKNLLLFIVLLSVSISFGQEDTIYFINSNKVPAVIAEVSNTVIRYRKAENPNGPLYVAELTEIRSITYRNGMQETFSKKQAPPTQLPPVPPSQLPPAPMESRREREARPVYSGVPSKYSGPRVGITYLTPGSAADEIRNLGKQPYVSQFGWQFETRIFTSSTGISGLAEFVPLIGGMEQGLFLPSASLLFGFRVRDGVEVAVGPNLSLSGLGMVLAIGTSFHLDDIYFPVNLVFVPNVTKSTTKILYNGTRITTTENTGARISLIVGFNIRRP